MQPLYLFYGEERYLIRREIEELAKKFPAEAVSHLDGISAPELLEALSVPSLFNPQRLLILTDFDLREINETLLRALVHLPPGVTLVLDSPEGLDRRSKIYKTVEKHAVVREHKMLTEWNSEVGVDFCLKTASELKKRLTRASAEKLMELSGLNLGRLYKEIEKLATYVGEREEITEEDIEKMVSRQGVDAFKLASALRRRDLPLALTALDKLLGEDREDPHELLGLIGSQLRILLKMKVLGRRTPAQMAQEIGGSSYYLETLSESLDRFSLDELSEGLERLLRCDLNLKTGYDARVEMPLLLYELINVKG
jgi:DNA polymerase-3 subunit delta